MTHLRLHADQHAMIGYGSLLSIASMERTLGERYDGPLHLVRVAGWRRGWDVQMPNTRFAYRVAGDLVTAERVLYLNVRPVADSHINAALFVVSSAALALFDEREWVYDRIDVKDAIEGVRITGGGAWMYTAKPENLWRQPSHPPQAIIRRTYLDILDAAHADLGPDFEREYEATTDAVPRHLVVDDIIP